VLFTGDVVMSVFPAVSGQFGDIDKWLLNLAAFNLLNPTTVVPAHGRLGGVELVRRYRRYLETVRERVLDMKNAGDSIQEITATLTAEIAAEFSDLAPSGGNPSGRINAAIQAAYRLTP
jgi:glyoxylase-like metal-dependent hydrolase (beta-lactamase superfamily II)